MSGVLVRGGAAREGVAGAKRRASQATGFKEALIVPVEAETRRGRYERMWFTVKGRGFWTDFEDWGRAEEYDEEEI